MSDQASSSTDLRSFLAQAMKEFPFACEFSLAPLVAFWERAARQHSAQGALARSLQERLRQAPELAAPVLDPAVLDSHRDLLAALMSAIFPPASWEEDFGAAVFPFYPQGFYATPSFMRTVLGPDGTPRGRVNLDAQALTRMRLLNAYSLILKRVYGIELVVDYPLVFTFADPETGLDRHFKGRFDLRFLEVESVGPTPVLDARARQRLQSRITDVDVLQELLPPAAFRFRGFSVMKEVEVTDQEVVSALKRDLIDKESIVSETRFLALQEKLRTLFRRPKLNLALAAIDGDRVLKLNSGLRLEHACIFADSVHHKTSDFAGSIFERAVLERRPLIIEDLEEWPGRTCVEDAILQHGARNVVVAPLVYQDAVIGTFELLSSDPGDLNATHAPMLPILDQLTHRIDGAAAELEVTLRSGDELTLINFLRRDIEPLFDHLGTFGPDVRERIDAYRSALDPQLGALYRQRKAFEDSITLINDSISAYVDMEEQAAQAMFPHYFEKQRTDGVDYSIYVGASLIEDGRYDPLYLRNLRLWQLMVACGVARSAERLKERLAVPLEVTNLILVQHSPLSIRFRFDEKRFDVDGAYNVRYEIIKKRIDKAVISGTSERLTQPGKLAIVYSQSGEAGEYRGYLDYLRKLGYLTPEVEELELEELQGVPGLRALRVTVDLANAGADTRAVLASAPSQLGTAAPR